MKIALVVIGGVLGLFIGLLSVLCFNHSFINTGNYKYILKIYLLKPLFILVWIGIGILIALICICPISNKSQFIFIIISCLSFYLSGFYIEDTSRRFNRMKFYGNEYKYVLEYGDFTKKYGIRILGFLSQGLIFFPASLILDWNRLLVFFVSILFYHLIDLIISWSCIFLLIYPVDRIYTPFKVIVRWIVFVILGFLFLFCALS